MRQRVPIFAIIPYPEPITGGIQADIKIVDELRALGWEVETLCVTDPDQPPPRFKAWNSFTFNLRLIWRLKRVPSGFILVEDQGLSGAVGLCNAFVRRYRNGQVVLLTYHLVFNLWRHPIRRVARRLIEGTVARGADLLIATSQSTKRDLETLGIEPGRIRVVSLGPGSAPTRTSTPTYDAAPIVQLLTVGTVEPRKGLEFLLRALALLPKCVWQLDIVGCADVAHLAFLENLAQTLQLTDRVTFHGRVSDDKLGELMAHAQVYVSPSIGEGFGLAVLDAMQSGLAVVVSNAGSLPELVDNERTGLLVPPRDPAALAVALRRTMVDPNLRRRLGTAARDATRGRFSWEETGKQIDGMLSDLISERPFH